MSPKQTRFYRGLWGAAKKAQPALDRKALHAELGLPESSTAFTQEDFDRWKAHCLSLSQPENYRDQSATVAMPRTRRVWLAATLCQAMGREVEYALGTLRQMNRRGAMGGPERTLEDLSERQLNAVLTALRKECRRLWATKEELLAAMQAFEIESEIDEEAARAATTEALHVDAAPHWTDLHYDDLLIVLAALRHVAAQPF
jgi:hypothetical protein